MKLSISCAFVLASVFLLIGGSLAGTTSIPGSQSASVTGSGTTAGTALTTYDTPTAGSAFVTNQVLMDANVPGGSTGSATIAFINAVASKTISSAATTPAPSTKPVYSLTAGLTGNANAQVNVATAGSTANDASAELFSTVSTGTIAGTAVPFIQGSSHLQATLTLDGTATGSASATGTAFYAAQAATDSSLSTAIDTAVSGNVEGNVKIDGTANSGRIFGTESPDISHKPYIYIAPPPTFIAIDDGPFNQPAISRIEADSNSNTNTQLGYSDAISATTKAFTDGVAKNGFLSSALTSATGSLDGSAKADAATIQAPGIELGLIYESGQAEVPTIDASGTIFANSKMDSTMDFGVQAYNENDQAIGYARMQALAANIAVPSDIATNTQSAPSDIAANTEVATYGSAQRTSTGTNNLVYGHGDITNAVWSTSMSQTGTGTDNPFVSASGDNGFVANNPALPGFRAAATLLGRGGTNPDTMDAFQDVQQTAAYAGTPSTSTTFELNLEGPIVDTVQTNAVGAWAAVSNQEVSAGDDTPTNALSTNIPSWNGIRWIEGSNPNPVPGYQSISPISFTGSVTLTNPSDTVTITPTSRDNDYLGSTSQ